ncbi:isopenicillin N synthase family dioxygenase [Dactylosporangium sp. NPDC048998]|uniref:isopenicillin N synthase family dioxygenase n=1 Tax=Dactylosporangium sp. NPDC048998 TaxID=3363976 RepID=UPI0037119379
MSSPQADLPVVDVANLIRHGEDERAAHEIESACRVSGFFYVSGHGVNPALISRLDRSARAFFALPEADKLEIAMARGGRAWRGFFPVGAELTSGVPDQKEGLYFGTELGPNAPQVRAGLPLHGANLFPRQVPELRGAVLEYLAAMTATAQAVLRGVAQSLDLPADYFASGYTANPTVLFRIFHYPPTPPDTTAWGVGEHTDYGLLTLLLQDDNGGLQVRMPDTAPAGDTSAEPDGERSVDAGPTTTAANHTDPPAGDPPSAAIDRTTTHDHPGRWLNAPPIPGTFVCNIGDMLDRMTGGWYRSTPHRVRNVSGNDRLSFPLFFDPDFTTEVPPLPGRAAAGGSAGARRWDGQDLRAFTGTYGEYLVRKVGKVFPELSADVGSGTTTGIGPTT